MNTMAGQLALYSIYMAVLCLVITVNQIMVQIWGVYSHH